MKGRCKKLITDINRGALLDSNLKEYINLLNGQYNLYATVKMCMNYFTMKEVVFEHENKEADFITYFNQITELIEAHLLNRQSVSDEAIDKICELRNRVEYKMKILTSYTDGYEVYEYILNRIEARVMNTTEKIDIDQLSAKLFQYVFMENDTVLINSKLQLIMSQLPVRMTKMKFYDIVGRTIAIYNGSEKKSVDEFVDMLRTAILINKPEGFEKEYPSLYQLYMDISCADYKNMDKTSFEELNSRLSKAAEYINDEASAYLLLQEIINDVYTICLTIDTSYDDNMGISGFRSAITILDACTKQEDVDDLPEQLMPKFIDIEGVQENIYESIMILEAAFEDIYASHSDKIKELGLDNMYQKSLLIEKLLSTSLFIDLEKEEDSSRTETADNEYINSLREKLLDDLATAFDGKDKMVVRSIMSKLLASMPIFLNSQQEIKDYFEYVLNHCKDDSELTACNKLLCDIIEED
ncbi:MAG: hypothetical protein ACI4D8_09155 [Wujia sp.]